MPSALRTETGDGVREIVLSRPEAYNTIDLALRDELSAALDEADADDSVKVILLRAEGRAFCAGYDLGWSTAAQAAVDSERVWDSVADMRVIGSFADVFSKLWDGRKPSVAAVQGWCVAGGTDLVMCADLIVAADNASFGYPPARVWGTPTTAMWTHRLGFQQAKRYLLTGDEIPAEEAVRIGLALEVVPAAELEDRARELARRIARLPLNQLIMLKTLCNQPAEASLKDGRRIGVLFDGIARHTQEGLDFVSRAEEVGFRDAVRERDDPFGDYGSRPRR
ncbi:MAG: crotonase/enoyl-CoA hydratase family protein [Gaiellaceae bacterium]